jgi:hypothetical protein
MPVDAQTTKSTSAPKLHIDCLVIYIVASSFLSCITYSTAPTRKRPPIDIGLLGFQLFLFLFYT